MVFLESVGQNLSKTTLTCNFWIIIVDFRSSNSLIPVFFEAPCIYIYFCNAYNGIYIPPISTHWYNVTNVMDE